MIYFRTLSLNQEAQDLADKHNFQLSGYRFVAEKEETRASRIVRIGLIQNEIVIKDTSENVNVQRDALYQRMAVIMEAAALAGINVLCFQEAWSKISNSNIFHVYKVYFIQGCSGD